jgi:hypothetical protein
MGRAQSIADRFPAGGRRRPPGGSQCRALGVDPGTTPAPRVPSFGEEEASTEVSASRVGAGIFERGVPLTERSICLNIVR